MLCLPLVLLIFVTWNALFLAEERDFRRGDVESVLPSLATVGEYRDLYQQYLKKHGKSLDRLLDHAKLAQFVKSFLSVQRHNGNDQNRRYSLEINEFADLTEDEINERFGFLDTNFAPFSQNKLGSSFDSQWNSSQFSYRTKPHQPPQPPPSFTQQKSNPPSQTRISPAFSPERINWSTEENPIQFPIVTTIHSQGSCGACWAFVTASIVEAAIKMTAVSYVKYIAKEKDPQEIYSILYTIPTLSAQQLLDCDRDGDNGCGGGNLLRALEFVLEHGLVSESVYGYTGQVAKCPATFPNTSRYYIQHINSLEAHTDAAIFAALQNGPVGIGVCGTQEDFMLYGGGVYDNAACCDTLNHAMLIVGVGYDKDLGVDYWVVMNSWGHLWGERGYMRILRRGPGAYVPPQGICGLYMFPVQASDGYIALPNGGIAYINHPYPWTAYYYYMYRLWHFLLDHWRYVALVLSVVMFGCSFGFFAYGCYLDYKVRNSRRYSHRYSQHFPGQQVHRRPDRGQYMSIPDHDCANANILPP